MIARDPTTAEMSSPGSMFCSGESPSQRSGESWLGFRVGGYSLALPLRQIAEVRSLRASAPVFAPPDFATGFVLLNARAVPLVDLRIALGVPAALDERTRLIASRSRHRGRAQPSVVLVVDEIQTLFETAPEIDGVGQDCPAALESWVERTLWHEGRRTFALCPERLVAR